MVLLGTPFLAHVPKDDNLTVWGVAGVQGFYLGDFYVMSRLSTAVLDDI